MTDQSILLVCAANVCRSPLAELALRRGLGAASSIRVSSAGVRAIGGDRICTVVAARHGDDAWREQADAHRAREVSAALLEQSSVVLAASRDIRGELVRIAPRSRDRIFTIKEAAHLGAGFSSSPPDRVAAYVAHLDRSRTLAPPLAEPRGVGPRLRRLFGSGGAAGDPASIADRHGSRDHHRTISDVEVAIAMIVAQLREQRHPSSR